jgi:hypothetical protein
MITSESETEQTPRTEKLNYSSGLSRRAWNLRFDALRNAHYHKARQRRLDTWSKTANFLVVVLGTTAAADLGKDFFLKQLPTMEVGATSAAIGFLVAVTGALQLVYDWSGRARTHEFLQRRFYEVIAKIEEKRPDTEEFLSELEAEMVRIYADEPATLRALDAVAYNETVDALGSTNGRADRLVVTWLQRLLMHWYAFSQAHFLTEGEKRARSKGWFRQRKAAADV